VTTPQIDFRLRRRRLGGGPGGGGRHQHRREARAQHPDAGSSFHSRFFPAHFFLPASQHDKRARS
jgi:hypothetical protein